MPKDSSKVSVGDGEVHPWSFTVIVHEALDAGNTITCVPMTLLSTAPIHGARWWSLRLLEMLAEGEDVSDTCSLTVVDWDTVLVGDTLVVGVTWEVAVILPVMESDEGSASVRLAWGRVFEGE